MLIAQKIDCLKYYLKSDSLSKDGGDVRAIMAK